MTHRNLLQRVLHVLAAVGIASAILAAAPVAEAFRNSSPLRADGLSGSRVPLASPASGDLVARLSISRLGIEAPVYEGVGGMSLARGAGHLPGTALPGEEGGTNNSVLAIQRDSAAAALAGVRVGEVVTMRTPFGVRRYRVSQLRILAPEDLDVAPSRAPRVTLVTPYPVDSAGPAPMRLAVILLPRG